LEQVALGGVGIGSPKGGHAAEDHGDEGREATGLGVDHAEEHVKKKVKHRESAIDMLPSIVELI